MSKSQPCFTVFTPTYNRGQSLLGVYDSLKKQTFRDFEWLIVDDGSIDETAQLVEQWQHESGFPIRYFWQENGGKHRAFNRGVKEAKGLFFLCLDSDDTCIPEALERFMYHWESIPDEEKHKFSAITALCMDKDGKILGHGLPAPFIDSDSLEISYYHGVVDEKWGFHKTDVLRDYSFPEFSGEKFVPESLVWNRISEHYRTRYVNEALRVYQQRPDGLSVASVLLRKLSPKATALYYKELLESSRLPYAGRYRAAVNLVRFSFHSGTFWQTVVKEAGSAWVVMSLPAAVLAWCVDFIKRQSPN